MSSNSMGWCAVLAMVSAGCVSPLRMINGPMVPAAEGQVTVDYGANDNTRLLIKVEHLAPPGKVDPVASVYLVWALASQPGAAPQNLGALKVADDLSGTLEAKTALKQFELFITPEATAAVVAPAGPKVLTTSVSR